jgi:hypothetical protein
MGRLSPHLTSRFERASRLQWPGRVGREGIALKVRVVLVTTRAALRHTVGDAAKRRAVIERGRALLDDLRAEHPEDGALIDEALADLNSLPDP